MIVLDSSAAIAILSAEPEAEAFSDLVVEDGAPHASAVTLLESRIVLSSRGGARKLRELEEWLRGVNVVAVAFDEAQTALAQLAQNRDSASMESKG